MGKVGLNGPGVGEREKLELDLFDTSRSPAPFFTLEDLVKFDLKPVQLLLHCGQDL